MGNLNLKQQLAIAKIITMFICISPVMIIARVIAPNNEIHIDKESHAEDAEGQPLFGNKNDSLKNYVEANVSHILLVQTYGAYRPELQNYTGTVFHILNEDKSVVEPVIFDNQSFKKFVNENRHLLVSLTEISKSQYINLNYSCYDFQSEIFQISHANNLFTVEPKIGKKEFSEILFQLFALKGVHCKCNPQDGPV